MEENNKNEEYKNYLKEKINCNICNCKFNRVNKSRHTKSLKHIYNLNKNNTNNFNINCINKNDLLLLQNKINDILQNEK